MDEHSLQALLTARAFIDAYLKAGEAFKTAVDDLINTRRTSAVTAFSVVDIGNGELEATITIRTKPVAGAMGIASPIQAN